MLKFTKKLLRKKAGSCSVVIVAAGSSNRMNGTDKILYNLGGDPVIVHSIRAFDQHIRIREIIVVTREDLIGKVDELCKQNHFDKVSAVVAGGNNRVESVMKGLDFVSDNTEIVAIHDGARPFVSSAIISDTIEKAMDYHAAAPAVAVKDTIKTAKNNLVTGTPDRSTLFAVQTPQVFDFDLLRGALVKAMEVKLPITDDCSAVEALGMSVYLTSGSDENIKITTPTDLILAQAIWEGRT